MRVKKFEAKTMREALQMVKNELGPDAVILSARDNRRAFGLGGEASVEITAAVSESTLMKKRFVESRLSNADRERFYSIPAREQKRFIDRMIEGRMQDFEPTFRRPITTRNYIDIPDEEPAPTRRAEALGRATGRNVGELLNDFERDFDYERVRGARNQASRPKSAIAQPRVPASEAPVKKTVAQPSPQPPQSAQLAQPAQAMSESAINRIKNAAKEAWRAGFSITQDSKPANTPSAARPAASGVAATPSPARDSEIAALKSEIERLQKLLEGFQKVPQSLVGLHPGAEFGLPYDLSFMFQKLVDAGVTIDHTVEMLSRAAKEIDPIQMKKKPIVDAWVARFLLNNVQTVASPWAGRIHLFIGGAGSGKTSQLVKAASHLVVTEKKKVAILTTDSYKVGAVDQLKIYCQILNVPFAVIRNRKDWEWVLSQLSHIDHILVDFPGLQLKSIEEIDLLKSLLPPPEAQVVSHLCVSATTKDGDAYEIARRYKVAEFNDLIFTNLDQSVQHGIIYNVHRKTGKPLHSFGIGNRIPEDFELATKERVLDLIFKLSRLRRETK